MTTMTAGRRLQLGLLLVFVASKTNGEIRRFSGVIPASASVVHYSKGYIVAPGFIDISNLVFRTLDDGSSSDIIPNQPFPQEEHPPNDSRDDDEETGDDDLTFDDTGTEDNGGDSSGKGVDGGGDRALDDASSSPGTTIDIVFFREPKHCSNSRAGCDWTKLGIGGSDGSDMLRWCCSNQAIDLGFCEGGNQYGRLIVNATTYKGQHRFITIPAKGEFEGTVKYGKLEEPKDSGTYVMVIANCNEEGRFISVDGKYTWKSKHGYLPGNVFGEMYFYVILTICYLTLLLWYGISMRIYEDATIPIQKWILGTIAMGLLEAFFRTGDYFVWNEDGTRFWFAMYTGVIVGVFKSGISRCLVVMVSLGWGVVRDTLGFAFQKVVALGFFYVGFSGVLEIMSLFAVTENETLTDHEQQELYDSATFLTAIVAIIDITFYLWILDALNGTMQYLENMNQNSKLQRYLHLRCILLLSILFAVVWLVFGVVNKALVDDVMVEEQQEWVVNAAMHVNYFMVLVGVSYLWRPNPNAKEYAYVMELPALGGSGGEENELEMTANVPSALDDDDDDDMPVSNGHDGDCRVENDEKLKIEEGIKT